jgi:aminoglycoside 6'-N-acetyltransferase I
VLGHGRRIGNLAGHTDELHEKLAFVVIGVLPDANGPRRPDILMAKRVGR